MEQKNTNIVEFFDFQFVMNEDGTLKETRYKNFVFDPDLGNSLFAIKEKYLRKVKQHKFDEKRMKSYNKEKEARIKTRNHLEEHIKKSETKLSEYKNTILAFGKLATCNSISK